LLDVVEFVDELVDDVVVVALAAVVATPSLVEVVVAAAFVDCCVDCVNAARAASFNAL
jgi:hypothetical protein